MDYPPSDPENEPIPVADEMTPVPAGNRTAPGQIEAPDKLSGRAAGEESPLAEPMAVPDKNFYSLDPQFVRAEQAGNLAFTVVLMAGAVIWLAIRWWFHGLDLFFYILAAASFVVVVMTLWFGIFWPIKTFRRTRWFVDESGLEIHKGVLWRHRIVVPMSRVQHADVSQGPLQRAFDLGTLTVHTAGTSNASVELAGLNHGVAVQVRDDIVRTRSDPHVS